MAKRKRAAKLALASADGFLNNPLLQQAQSVGSGALGSLAQLLGIGAGPQGSGGQGGQSGGQFDSFLNSPFFRSQLEAGQRAISSNAALRGRLGSGDTARAAIGYGQRLAGQSLGQFLDANTQLANAGQSAATNQAGAIQAANTGASNVWLQPGALGKAAGALSGFIAPRPPGI